MTGSTKTDPFYRPVSKPVSKQKRPRNSAVKTGFEEAVMDSGLSQRYRLQALGRLPGPSRRFLVDLIRTTGIPSLLKFEATRRLEQIQLERKEARAARRQAEELVKERKRRAEADRLAEEMRKAALANAQREAIELLAEIQAEDGEAPSDTTLSPSTTLSDEADEPPVAVVGSVFEGLE